MKESLHQQLDIILELRAENEQLRQRIKELEAERDGNLNDCSGYIVYQQQARRY